MLPNDEPNYDFPPELGEEQETFQDVQFNPAKNSAEFKAKADLLMSDAMDYLSAKIRSGMAESGDIKTAVDLGKHYKVGIETVDDAAAKAFNEAEMYHEVETEDETSDDPMRYQL